MKKYLFYISFIFLFTNTYAQDYSFSKATKLNAKTPRFKILGKNINYIIAERWGAKTHYLDLYNTSLKKVSSKEIAYVKDEKIIKIWIQPKQGWIIYTKLTKESSLLLARKMDAKVNIKTKPLLLDSIQETKGLIQANLRTKYSLNEKYFAVYMPVLSKEGVDHFSVKIYDTNLKIVQNVKIKDASIKNGKYVTLKVLNDGSFVMVYKEENSTNRFKYFYKETSASLLKKSLNINYEIFKFLRFEIDNYTNELICAGFRMAEETKKNEASDAFFSFRLNIKTGAKSKNVLEEFSKEFYTLLTGRESKTEKVTLQTFRVKKILPKIDGGYLVFAESFYESVETTSSPYISNPYNKSTADFEQNSYKSKSYHYNDIILYTIDNKFSLESVNIINKRQTSYDDKGGYSSFVLVNQQDKLNVLFLDDISTDSSLKNYEVDKTSDVDSDYVFNVSQNNVMPVVKMSVQTTPTEVLIPSFLNNSFSIIKVNFED